MTDNPFAIHYLPDAEVFIARSTSTDRLYFVICHDGKATCTCPATKTCKHIKRVQAAQASRVEHGHAGRSSLLVAS